MTPHNDPPIMGVIEVNFAKKKRFFEELEPKQNIPTLISSLVCGAGVCLHTMNDKIKRHVQIREQGAKIIKINN